VSGVTDQGTQAETEGAAITAPVSRSDAALARYRRSLRFGRAVYYLIVGVIVAALAVTVAVAWSGGEAAHESLHTHAPAPPSLAVRTPSPTVQVAWRTSDRIALGVPQWGGTVVTYSGHTLRGRAGRTGASTWTYTRTDRTICTAAQMGGTAVAIFANKGNCDEVSAFDSDTGQRRWTRTLDMDGMPLNGRPNYRVLSYTLLVWTPSVIYAVDPVTGYNRWTYSRYGCTIQHVALGTAGALISQNCASRVQCKGMKFCGQGPQLLLRDGSAGNGTDSKPNADQIKWNKIGDTRVPASAGQVVSAIDPASRTLAVLDPGSGNNLYTVPLAGVQTFDPNAIATSETTAAQVIWIAGETYALRADATKPNWTTATSAPPTIVSTTGADPPTLASARITVTTSTGIALLRGTDGRRAQQFDVASPGTGSLVYPLGAGFLVTSASGVVAYS
jgi:hypothetical protein